MGQFSAEKLALPGQFSVEINTEHQEVPLYCHSQVFAGRLQLPPFYGCPAEHLGFTLCLRSR